MLGYLTEINLKDKTVVTTFRGEQRTFFFNERSLSMEEALILAAQDMHTQIFGFLHEAVNAFEEKERIRRP